MRATREFLLVSLFAAGHLTLAGCSPGEPVQEISVDENQLFDAVEAPAFAADDWPAWRGPTGNGVAGDGVVPTSWSETENVVWRQPVPGRGHASPAVVGDRVFLSTAEAAAETQTVLCFDRETGRPRWQTTVHNGGLPRSLGSGKSTHASASPASDGARVFASFLNDDAIWVTALDFDGEQLWQTNAGPFDSSYGYAASPAIYKSLVIIAADHKGGGFVAALHRKTGKVVWRKPRPAEQSYSSPLVANVAGQDQVLLCGAHLVAAYDPNTGNELWSRPGTTMSCAGTMNYWGDLVFAGSGYPDSGILCVRGDGSAVVWENGTKLYVPSLVVHDGYVYAANDDGVAYCWDAETGESAWTGRLGGNFSASPIIAGGHIYVPNERGVTFVFRATPQRLDVLARNQLGDESMASPVICGDRIYLRVASHQRRTRQETLYAIGTAD